MAFVLKFLFSSVVLRRLASGAEGEGMRSGLQEAYQNRQQFDPSWQFLRWMKFAFELCVLSGVFFRLRDHSARISAAKRASKPPSKKKGKNNAEQEATE